MVINEEDKGRVNGKTCVACDNEGHFKRHHVNPATASNKDKLKSDYVRRDEVHALTDSNSNMQESISAVTNVVTKKFAGGNPNKSFVISRYIALKIDSFVYMLR